MKHQKIAIIGFGKFGKLLSSLLSPYAAVYVYSENMNKKELIDNGLLPATLSDINKCSIVIMSVPISSFETALHEINPHLKAGTTLIDVCSVKLFPTNLMKKHVDKSINILGTHPMWGPESVSINKGVKNLKVVLCPVRIEKTLLDKITTILKKAELEILIESPAEHDKKAASSQALAQFVGKILELMPLENIDISTLGYKQLKGLIPFVSGNTNQLFHDLQNYNPFSSSIRKRFMEIALHVSRDLSQGDKKIGVKK